MIQHKWMMDMYNCFYEYPLIQLDLSGAAHELQGLAHTLLDYDMTWKSEFDHT
jgi:hypothetical protein